MPVNTDILDTLIVGLVEPHIYAFTTETVPNYLKVGDTYRPVHIRLKEWSNIYPGLRHICTRSARIDDNTIFRDYSVHRFLEETKNRPRLLKSDFPSLHYYSSEFFKDATEEDVDEAIADIHASAESNDGRYRFYSSDHLPKQTAYTRGKSFTPRDNQQAVIDNFKIAVQQGRHNLLMFAVMRFGKSFTSMCCAVEMNAKSVLVVSAKADVKDEWKRTVEGIGNFEGYIFADRQSLSSDSHFLKKSQAKGFRVVLFLTLQDLQGTELKAGHREVFTLDWDLLLVDETHFGARAEHYGNILRTKKELRIPQKETERQLRDVETLDRLDHVVKELHANITIHLSGTPYRILMGSEFEKEDIIAFVQYSDIANAQKNWDESHKYDEESQDWDNPYFGFPQMVRFAFHPNQSSLDRLESLRATGATTSFAELFRPQSLVRSGGRHKKFVHEDVVLDLLKVIDGSKNDANVLGFLDNRRIKEGKLCRHIVVTLPYCASCDAMEEMLRSHASDFKHLSEYEIINISGLNNDLRFSNTDRIKKHIASCATQGKKTITLTVNRMLTGNTVPQWDTMLYFKQSVSPEEYDQAVFRLQNPFIDEYTTSDGKTIRLNMKPQTILVDFNPDRVLRLQERKSQIYNINTDNNGNSRLRERIEAELSVSPIITLDHNRLREVTVTDVLDAVRDYSRNRSVIDEAREIPLDSSLLDNEEICKALNRLKPIDSTKGILTPMVNGKPQEGDDIDTQIWDEDKSGDDSSTTHQSDDEKEDLSLAKRLASYYALILFYAFLTEDEVDSLESLISSLDRSGNNIRLARNLGLTEPVLRIIQNNSNGFSISRLDYKIQNTNDLIRDHSIPPLQRVRIALTKFGRMSESEIVTPPEIAGRMVRLLPERFADSDSRILDIASKQGEFAAALLQRYGSRIADKVYSVCTSPLAYEFTRKVYGILSLPVDHIFENFTSYDLIQDNAGQYIDLLRTMRFSAILGNPPYHDVNEGNGNGANPIYHKFIDFARQLTPVGSMIHPARFLFNAGKTPKEWNRKMLSDVHFKVAEYMADSSSVFNKGDVTGGIAITCWDVNRDFGKIGTFLAFPELRGIVDKVTQSETESFSSAVYPRDLYKLTPIAYEENPVIEGRHSSGHRYDLGSNAFTQYPELFYDTRPATGDYIRVLGKIKQGRIQKWIKRIYVRTPDNIDRYKVLVPKSNGSGAIGETDRTPVIGIPEIGEPGNGHTLTFLSIGSFDTLQEAQAVLKYVRTKFARTLLGTLKVTQDNPKEAWVNVPMQNFSEDSDIDWTLDVEDIDRQLYAKYDLSKEEIEFIESRIKPL